VDRDRNLVFTGDVFSVHAENVTVRELLDRLVQAAPDYQWEAVAETDLINLYPKQGSRLDFQVSAFEASGRLDEILSRMALRERLPGLIERGPALPAIDLMFRGGTGRDLLNAMLSKQRTMVWRVHEKSMSFRAPTAEPNTVVDVVYDIKRGEPILFPPDFWSVRYEVKALRDRDGYRVQVERVPFDLVERDTAALPEPQRTLTKLYVSVVRAMLREDVEAFMAVVHPEGVRDGTKLLSREELESGLKRAFEKKDYAKLHLADVLDLKQIQVEAKPNGRYRVVTKPKIKSIDGQLYFDDELWFTFEKSKEGKWLIVELD
jgi:hypothetical protein